MACRSGGLSVAVAVRGVPEDDLAVHLRLAGRRLDRKLAALRAMAEVSNNSSSLAISAEPIGSASTAGMSVAKAYTLAMLIAGALAGLAATMQILGRNDSLTANVAGSIGFDAITVALLGRATPLGTVLAGLLFGALAAGGIQMQASEAATPVSLTMVLQALIVLFVAAPALVRGAMRMKDTGGGATVMAKGWGS